MQGRLAENSVGGCIQRVQARGFHRAGWHDVYEVGGVGLEPRVAGKRGCLPSEQLELVNMPDGGAALWPSRHVRVVDGHERVRSVPVPEPGSPLELRGHGQPGGFSCGKLLRLEAHRRRLRRRRLVGRGRVEDPERKPPNRGGRTPRQQVRVVVLYAPSGGGHRGRTDGDPLRRGRRAHRGPRRQDSRRTDRHRRQDHLHWHAPRRSKDSLRADQADGEVLRRRVRAPFRVALGGYLL